MNFKLETNKYKAKQDANRYRQILEDNQLKLSQLWEQLNADPNYGNDHWISRVIVDVVQTTRNRIGPDKPEDNIVIIDSVDYLELEVEK